MTKTYTWRCNWCHTYLNREARTATTTNAHEPPDGWMYVRRWGSTLCPDCVAHLNPQLKEGAR